MLANFLPGVGHLQNIHPLVVHFPAAFLPGALTLYFFAWILGKESLAWAGFWMLILGTVGAAVAVGTGLYAGPGVMIAPSVRAHLLIYHKRLMIGALGVSLLLTGWALWVRPMPVRNRSVFIILLLVLAGLLTTGADYGARMVYDYNAGGNACPQPIDFTQ